MISEFNLEKVQKRFPKSEISFVEESKIGSGDFGDIIKSIFGINKKEYFVVVKRFKKTYGFTVSELRDESFNVWKFLKENKIPTFRKCKKYNNDSIVMENLSSQEKFCVSTNNLSSKNLDVNYLKKNRIKEILNFEELIENGLVICDKLDSLDIDLLTDAFFFIGDKNKSTKLNFIIGDFDNVLLNTNEYNNYNKFKDSFDKFLVEFVSMSVVNDYRNVLESIITKHENKRRIRK